MSWLDPNNCRQALVTNTKRKRERGEIGKKKKIFNLSKRKTKPFETDDASAEAKTFIQEKIKLQGIERS